MITQIPHKTWKNANSPLSYAQRRMWFLDRIQPEEIAYINTSIFGVEGILNVHALQRAFDSIVERHAILRTTYSTEDTVPVQIIHENTSFILPMVDLSGLTGGEQDQEEKRLLEFTAQQPIDLTSEPSLRVIVVHLSSSRHTLLWSLHHIATDGWSGGILFRELASLYNAYCQNESNPLPPLPIQYADFAVWQHSWLQGDVLAKQLDYWRNHLLGLRPLELHTDHPRPPIQTYRGGIQPISLSPEQTLKLKSIMRQEHATLYMVLMAAFMMLLHRYSGQDDIAVGSPIAGRNRKEIEGLIGFFVNTMVMRVDMRQVQTFRELIKTMRETSLGAFMHQDLPFEKLVEELHPDRSLSRTPLFQVVFALQNTPGQRNEFHGLDIQRIPNSVISTRFDLECHMSDRGSNISGRIIYNRDLFESETIKQMAESFQVLIDNIIYDPGQFLSEYQILSASQAINTLVNSNRTAVQYSKERNVCEIFESVVEQYPDAVALVNQDKHITYNVLNKRANQLAEHLRTLGVKLSTPVGICTDRSITMVVAMLGILKAGGCYVPIDPTYPQKRIAFMTADTGLDVVLTQDMYTHLFTDRDLSVISLDRDWKLITDHQHENLGTNIHPQTPIYIMYTSGSTGRPKGIMISHQAVVHLVKNANYAALDRAQVIAQGSNIAFDAATFEIWGGLLSGGRIVFFNRDIYLSPKELERELRSHSVTTMFMTTALFNTVARENPQAFSSLQQLLFGGEAVTPKWVKRILEKGAPGRLLHVYGPTETTTFASWHLADKVLEGAQTIPIGRPVSNTRLYVLDEYLQPLPVGAVGELFIGGDRLAAGYINKPRETAEKFIPDPFNQIPGSRMYSSGDMVRRLSTGALQFIGRKDQQVKIRGFRIELEEIGIALTQHPAIREACVAVYTKNGEEKQLVAYFVENEEGIGDKLTFRTYLKDHLPDYMIPSTYVSMQSLPLTSSGKIDRQRLPAPGQRNEQDLDIPLASDNLELLLTNIWKSVLRADHINRNDNFFDIGGHSLLGVQMLDQIRRYTGKEIPVSVLFEAPTVALMSDLLRKNHWASTWDSLVPIKLEGKRLPLFLVPPAGNTVLNFAHIISALNDNQPIFGMQYKGLDGVQTPYIRVEDIAAHFIREIRKIQPTGPYVLGGICFGAHIAFEMARQLELSDNRVALLFVLDAGAPVSGPSWIGGALVNRNLLYYAKRLIYRIRRRELFSTIYKKLMKKRSGNLNHLLPVNKILEKHNIGIQQVFNANLEARAHYRAIPIRGKLVLITSELFHKYGYVSMWAELAPNDFEYEVFDHTTHHSLLLERERGARIAEIMQNFLDQLYVNSEA